MYRLKESEKTIDRAKELIDEFAPTYLSMSQSVIQEYNQDVSNYRLYNNLINQEEFEPYCNPLGISIANILREIKPYNKTYQNIDILLGEELKRNDSFSAYLINSESDPIADMEFMEHMQKSVSEIMNVLQIKAQKQAGAISEEEFQQKFQEMMNILNVDEMIDNIYNFQTSKEIFANHVINYLKVAKDLYSLKNEGFFHALIADKELVYVNLINGQPEITILNPLYTFFEKGTSTKYIQDGNWAGTISYQTAYEVLENFSDEMTLDEISRFQDKTQNSNSLPKKTIDPRTENTFTNRVLSRMANFQYVNKDEVDNGLYGENYSPRSFNNSQLYEVVHMEWKWLRKVGFLTFFDENGEEQMIMVDSEYPIPKDIKKVKYKNKYGKMVDSYEWLDENQMLRTVEYMWIPDIWEGYRIDGDIYVNIQRRPYQNISIDNPFKNKLSYHGRRFNSTNAPSISMMGRMKPYQFLYFVVMYQMGELVSKNKGTLIAIDVSQVDPNIANGDAKLALEKTLWYQQHGLIIYNSLINSQGGTMPPTRAPGGQAVNVSTTTDMLNLANLLNWLEIEIGKAAGISPQRAAQFSSNTNVSDNQQAITQSSHITEKYFNIHLKLWCEVINSYIDLYTYWAKQRIMDGGSISIDYILPNKMRQSLKVEPKHVRLADVGVFINSSAMSDRYLQMMEELTMAFAQNDGTIIDISNILKARSQGTSPEELHESLLKAQSKREKQMQQQQQMEMQARKEGMAEYAEKKRIDAEAEIMVVRAKGEEDRMSDNSSNN